MHALLIAVMLAAQPAKPSETLLQKLLRIAGLTAAPSQMRAPGGARPGAVWIADLDGRTTAALTKDANYRSPVFSLSGTDVYALKGDTVVRIGIATGSETAGKTVRGAVKLVGFDRQHADELVLLVDPEGYGSPLVSLSLNTGVVRPLHHDATSADERRLLAAIRAGDRTYGDTRVYTRTESRSGLTRKVEWTDVYIARGAAAPANVSACGGVDCGDPALSPDGRRIAYIKSG